MSFVVSTSQIHVVWPIAQNQAAKTDNFIKILFLLGTLQLTELLLESSSACQVRKREQNWSIHLRNRSASRAKFGDDRDNGLTEL